MKKKTNPLGLLSLISLVCLLGPATGNAGWYGFLGFLYYLRYFWVVPDEGFRMNVRAAGSIAFFMELFAVLPALLIFRFVLKSENYIAAAFGAAFAVAVFAFTVSLAVIELKEMSGLSND